MEDNALIVRDEGVRLGALQLAGPGDVINRAATIASELYKIVEDKKLYSMIQGKKFPRVEAWTTVGGMVGVIPQEAKDAPPKLTIQPDGYEEYEATVELVRVSDGAIVGRASAIVGTDEKTWASRPRYARRSMAVTRATGKAYRLGFSWIMSLAGYEPTPAEEMDGVIEGHYTEPQQQTTKTKTTPRKTANGHGPAAPVASAPQVLVDAGICNDIPSAAGLLNSHVPAEVRGDNDALVAWGKLYRSWRDAGTEPSAAAENATAGIALD